MGMGTGMGMGMGTGAHVVEDGQVVLDHQDVLVGHAAVLDGAVEGEGADELRRGHALLDVEEGGGLVEHVAVGVAHGRGGDGEALQLAARERLDLAIDEVREVEPRGDLLPALALVALLEHRAHRAPGHRAHVVRVQLHLHAHKARRSRRPGAGTRAPPQPAHRPASGAPSGGGWGLALRASTAAAEQPRPQAATLGEAGGLRARRAAARAAARQGVHACARVLPMHTLSRLDGDAQVVLEHPREVLLQLGAAVVREDLVPVGRLLGLAQVGLELAREHVERGRLAYAVGPEPGRGRPEGRWKAGGRVGDSGGGHARHRRTAAPPLEAVAPHECGGRPQPLDGAQSVESAPEHARLASCGTSGTPLSAGCRAGRAPSLAAASAGRAA